MVDVTLPQLGESVTEGTLGKWLKQVGDTVTQYEPLVEIMTDKVNAEVPSDFDGTLAEIVVQEGETVSVGTVICRIEQAGGQEASGTADESTSGALQTNMNSAAAGDGGVKAEGTSISHTGHSNERVENTNLNRRDGKARYSPAVLKLAQEHDIDLSLLQGSGAQGRITRKDVRQYIESGNSTSTQGRGGEPQAQSETSHRSPVDADTKHGFSGVVDGSTEPTSWGDQVIDPSPVRKTIAKRMVESKHTVPHAWTVMEADVTKMVHLRQKVKNDFQRKEGIGLTYMPFFIKAVAEALKQHPMLNAGWIDNQIHMHQSINISIAVATDDALAVPVIHNADRLSIAGLAHAVNELAAKARAGRLQMEDVQGGTFTVNNTGAFGSILSNPIINMPQSAILSVESIVKRPVVIDDAIAIRSMVNLCLSLDHRLLDGWISGAFMKAVKDRLQRFDQDTSIY